MYNNYFYDNPTKSQISGDGLKFYNNILDGVSDVSNLKIELGKLKSFIQEIEQTEKQSKEERKELRAIKYINNLLGENKNLRERNKKLSRENSDLIYKLIHNK